MGPVGEELQNADAAVFNPEWGIGAARIINQIRYPKADVIREALDLYQTAFRKPSLTVYCLDFSGSMKGEREERLKEAMRLILDQDRARQVMLQASPRDETVVILFNSQVIQERRVKGNDARALRDLWATIDSMTPAGGTDIYSPVIRAYELIQQRAGLGDCFPAVILMTDGESNTGRTFGDLEEYLKSRRIRGEVPTHAISFGEASEAQLKALTEATSGRVFDGKKDLATAFREVKGYN